MPKYFMHLPGSGSNPIYWRRRQSFAGIPIHINMNLLSVSLRDSPGTVPPSFRLVPRVGYNVGSGIGNITIQPRVVTDGTNFHELPIGPRLKNFLDYPIGEMNRMNLRPPFYDTTLGVGDSGGGWFRDNNDDSAWHGGFDVARGPDRSLFKVCAAARGTILAISSRDNAPLVLEHKVGRRSFLTIYQHLNLRRTRLRVGQTIGRGEELARISDAPSVPHLHFMVAAQSAIVSRGSPRLAIPAWFAIDAFGVYDFYLRRTNRQTYNYLPDVSPNSWSARIQGAVHPIQWTSQPLSSMM